jgi:hypothetical protein
MISLSVPSPSSPSGSDPCPADRPPGRTASATALPLPPLLAAVTIGFALLAAPEHPARQEAICQRHNGVEACRVW